MTLVIAVIPSHITKVNDFFVSLIGSMPTTWHLVDVINIGRKLVENGWIDVKIVYNWSTKTIPTDLTKFFYNRLYVYKDILVGEDDTYKPSLAYDGVDFDKAYWNLVGIVLYYAVANDLIEELSFTDMFPYEPELNKARCTQNYVQLKPLVKGMYLYWEKIKTLIKRRKDNKFLKITGGFFLNDRFQNSERALCGALTIQGSLLVSTYNFRTSSKDSIELPERLVVTDKVYLTSERVVQGNQIMESIARRVDNKYTTFDSVASYQNRPERVERLAKTHKEKAIVKEANESGILTFLDTKKIPLEVGCRVVYYYNHLETGFVVGQTNTMVKIQNDSGSHHYYNCITVPPENVMRLM